MEWENIDYSQDVIAFHQSKTQSEVDEATAIRLHPDFEAYLNGLKVRALKGCSRNTGRPQ
jgi:hypothetical protein